MKEHYCEYSRGTNNKLSTHDEANDKQLQVYCLKNPSSVSEFL